MKISITIPNRIAQIFEENPDIGRVDLADKACIKQFEARFYVKLWDLSQNQQESDIENDEVRVRQTLTKDYGTVDVNSLTISTLEDAIDVAEIDLEKWEIDKHVINSWQVTIKQDDGPPITKTNWQVKIWLKAKTPELMAIEVLLKEIAEKSPNVPLLHKPVKREFPKRELEINIMDPHLGLHCFKGGSDINWSIEKCEQMVLAMIDDLLKAGSYYAPFEQIIFPFGNDFMHSDNVFNTTTAGTPQPEADAWQYVYERAELLAIAMVEKLKKIAPVKIYSVPGNHDRHSAFTIARILNAWYRNDKNVEVNCSADPYKFHHYGVNLIGYEHGHSVQQVRLAALMANECRLNGWSEARYCEWHIGDQHRKGSSKPAMLEEQGVSVEYLPGLTPPNEWHRLKSYNWQKRAGMAFVWDKVRGPIARLQVNIDNYTGEIM